MKDKGLHKWICKTCVDPIALYFERYCTFPLLHRVHPAAIAPEARFAFRWQRFYCVCEGDDEKTRIWQRSTPPPCTHKANLHVLRRSSERMPGTVAPKNSSRTFCLISSRTHSTGLALTTSSTQARASTVRLQHDDCVVPYLCACCNVQLVHSLHLPPDRSLLLPQSIIKKNSA
jgi:hypothetical protein